MSRDLTAIGRTLMNRMVTIASANAAGAQLCTFTLISGAAYDVEAGKDVIQSQSCNVWAFIDRADSRETKIGGQDNDTVRLVLAADQLPRLPETQDEVTIDGTGWKVTGAEVDAMGVQLYVMIALA